MFTTFLKELGGYFDRHWLLSVFFPSLAFWSACLLVYGLEKGLGQTLEAWNGQTAQMQFVLLAVGLAWVTLYAYILGNFQTAIIRLFEGYWRAFPLSLLRESRLRHQRRVFRYLEGRTKFLRQETHRLEEVLTSGTEKEKDKALALSRELRELERERLLLIPIEEDKVMPTRLGNVIRAAELYAWKRYGMDAVVLWPRLHALLPKEFLDNLLGTKTGMVFMLMMSVHSFAFAILACAWLTLFTSSWVLVLFCALGMPFSWLCYKNALHGASLYGEMIKAAFDLHRWKLLEALHLKRPASYDEETQLWEDVTRLLYRSEPPTVAVYETAKSPPPAPSGGALVRFAIALEKFFCGADPRTTSQSGMTTTNGGERANQALPATHLDDQPLAALSAPLAGAVLRKTPQAVLTAGNGCEQADAGASHAVVRQPADLARPGLGARPATPPLKRPFDLAPYFCAVVYVMLVGAVGFRVWQRPAPQVSLAVAARDLPAYHLVTPQDLRQISRAAGGLPSEVLAEQNDIINRYTLEPVPAGSTIRRTQLKALPRSGLLDNTVSVGIPATPSMILGGSLKAGDVVDITVGVAGPQPPPAPGTFENLLVLDVKPVAVTPTTPGQTPQPTFVIVVALPSSLRNDFAASQPSAPLLIWRRPQ